MIKRTFFCLITTCFLVLFITGTNAQNNSSLKSITDEVFMLSKVASGEKIVVSIPEELQDLSSFLGISALVSNRGTSLCRVEGYLNEERWINSAVYLEPGEIKSLEIVFKRTKIRGSEEFPAMNGLPGGTLWHWMAIDPAFSEKITFIMYCEQQVSFLCFRPYSS